METVSRDATNNPILGARAAQVEAELAGWAARSPSFGFDPNGSHLYSVMELAYSYPKRASEFARVIRSLLEHQQLVPATIMARALTETTAVGCLYLHDMQRLVAAGELDKVEARFMKYYAGIRDHDIKPVHVNDAMRHLEKIDEAYFDDLAKRNPILAIVKVAVTQADSSSAASPEANLPLVSRNYALLSEVSHPNGLGTQYLYGVNDNPRFDGRELRERLAFLSVAAIWQCHHLTRALQRAESVPEEFRVKFLSSDH